jgi:hypothetical protein
VDTLAHGLWATAVVKANNKFASVKFRTGWFVFWGVLPDLFSFTPAVFWLLWQVMIEGVPFAQVPRPELLPPEVRMTFPVYRLSNTLYHLSHSLIIFAGIFLLVWAIRRYRLKIRQTLPIGGSLEKTGGHFWEMTGWMLHILIDIPTHTRRVYPTPFLWPLSDFTIDGISWGRPWFLALNYASLLIVFLLLRLKSRQKQEQLLIGEMYTPNQPDS